MIKVKQQLVMTVSDTESDSKSNTIYINEDYFDFNELLGAFNILNYVEEITSPNSLFIETNLHKKYIEVWRKAPKEMIDKDHLYNTILYERYSKVKD